MVKHENSRGKNNGGSIHPVIMVLVVVMTFGVCLATTATMQGQAQETSANFSLGSVKIGNDVRTCISSLEGSLRYFSSMVQFCDGDNWKVTGKSTCTEDSSSECVLAAPRSSSDSGFTAANVKDGVNILGVTGSFTGSGGCTAPTLCPNIGDVCNDSNAGTTHDPIFAGFRVYGTTCKPLFVTDENQSLSYWRSYESGSDDIANDSFGDGKINDGQIANSTSFPAFKVCKDLAYGGFTDWYLPARSELYMLFENKGAIDAYASGSFTTGQYWSSSESLISEYDGWYVVFSNGSSATTNKDYGNYRVRCVRRD